MSMKIDVATQLVFTCYGHRFSWIASETPGCAPNHNTLTKMTKKYCAKSY